MRILEWDDLDFPARVALKAKCEKSFLNFTRLQFELQSGQRMMVNWHHRLMASKVDELIAGTLQPGIHNANFNRAPFWYGDGIPPIHYYGQITLRWDGKTLNGQVVVNDLSVDDLDVTLVLTDAGGGVTNRYAVTDATGAFSVEKINGPVTVLAKTTLITVLCETFELESAPFNIPA